MFRRLMGAGRRRSAVAACGALALTSLLWIGAGHLGAQAATATDLYVSPSGSDSNAGISPGAPLKTLQKARDVVRGIDQSNSGEIHVNLAGGTYRLTAPLVLDASDSGTGGHSVTWQAAAGARPVVSGGLQVPGWTKGSGSVWSAQVPAGFDTRQLYVNGTRAQRATGALPI